MCYHLGVMMLYWELSGLLLLVKFKGQFLTMVFCYKGRKVLLQEMKQSRSHLLDGDQFFKAPIKKSLLVHISTPSLAERQSALLVEVADLLRSLTLQWGYLLLGGMNITLLSMKELNQSAKGHTGTPFTKRMR